MNIAWRPRALFDINAIEAFIERDNPAAARAIERRIRDVVSALADHPSMGRLGRIPNTRELVIAGTPYVVAYAVIMDRVEVLAVLHGARKWPDAF